MKIVDLDKLLKDYVKKYIAENKPDLKGDDFDDVLSDVYKSFETNAFTELGGKTPARYFDGYSGDYGELLKAHFNNGITVSDYFISSAVKCGKAEDLARLIDPENDEDIVISAIDILDKMNSKIAFDRYIDLLFDLSCDKCIVDKIVETLIPYADEVADKIIEKLDETADSDTRFINVLCNCKIKRTAIKKMLLNGFILGEKIPEYCSYAIVYNDESILSDLEEMIDGESDYVSFKELNLAIEALGGEPRSESGFEGDENYIRIKRARREEDDGDKDKD